MAFLPSKPVLLVVAIPLIALAASSCGGKKEKMAESVDPGGWRLTEMPDLPGEFLVRPVFRAAGADFSGGVAFFAQLSGLDRRVLLTANRLLGPGGGYFKKIDPGADDSGIVRIGLRDPLTDEASFDVRVRGLSLPAGPFGSDSAAGDVAAFLIEDRADKDAILLSSDPGDLPAAGDVVWVVGPLYPESGGRLFRAKVTDLSDGFLHYQLELRDLEIASCTGAPVVDAGGDLVGIQSAGTVLADGIVIAVATPVDRFADHLAEAIRKLDQRLTAKNADGPDKSQNPNSN